jgi:hypothetical protein
MRHKISVLKHMVCVRPNIRLTWLRDDILKHNLTRLLIERISCIEHAILQVCADSMSRRYACMYGQASKPPNLLHQPNHVSIN